MKANEIVEILKNCKGQHVQCVFARAAKTYKDCPFVIGKRTSAYIRAGIDYSNLASVKQGIESGERGEVQSLPWGTWQQFPFIISHKGSEYVRLYVASFNNLRPSVEWILDGKPVAYEQIERYLLSDEKRNANYEQPECFTVKAENIISIG